MELLKEKREQNKALFVTGFLWLATSVLSAFTFLATRRMVLTTYERFFPDGSAGVGEGYSLLNILLAIPLGIFVIVVIIGGFEYHFRRGGTDKSWRLLARTLAVEIAILMLALFI